MNTVLVIVGVVALFVLLLWFFKLRHRYPGLGWILDFKYGQVVVASRLLDSPAHRMGATIGHTVIEFNGVPMRYDKKSEIPHLVSHLKNVRVGQKMTVRLRDSDGHEWEATDYIEMIQGPIPVPHCVPRGDSEEEAQIHRGLAIDRRTGYLTETISLSEEAVNRMTHP